MAIDPEKLAQDIASATVLELNGAMKILEEKYGIKVQAPAVMGPAAPASAEASAGKEEKTSFNVELKAVGNKKIEVIKVVRDATGKGLKEAKDLVDAAAAAPQIVKENANKEGAEDLKKKFEAAGATVELK